MVCAAALLLAAAARGCVSDGRRALRTAPVDADALGAALSAAADADQVRAEAQQQQQQQQQQQRQRQQQRTKKKRSAVRSQRLALAERCASGALVADRRRHRPQTKTLCPSRAARYVPTGAFFFRGSGVQGTALPAGLLGRSADTPRPDRQYVRVDQS